MRWYFVASGFALVPAYHQGWRSKSVTLPSVLTFGPFETEEAAKRGRTQLAAARLDWRIGPVGQGEAWILPEADADSPETCEDCLWKAPEIRRCGHPQ